MGHEEENHLLRGDNQGSFQIFVQERCLCLFVDTLRLPPVQFGATEKDAFQNRAQLGGARRPHLWISDLRRSSRLPRDQFFSCEKPATPLLAGCWGHAHTDQPPSPWVPESAACPVTPSHTRVSFHLFPLFLSGLLSDVPSRPTSTSTQHEHTLGAECGDREAEKMGQKGFS